MQLSNETVIGKRYQILRPSNQQTEEINTYICLDKTNGNTVILAEFFPEYAERKEDNRVDYKMLPDDGQAAFQEDFYWKKRFGVLPTVPAAYELISENNTYYIAYEDVGVNSVGRHIARNRPFTYDSVRRLLLALLYTNRELLRFGLCQAEFLPQNVVITADGEIKLRDFRPTKNPDAPDLAVRSIAALGYYMITGKQPDASSKSSGIASGSNLSRLAKYLKWVYNLPLGAITVEQMISHAQINFDVDLSEQPAPIGASQEPSIADSPVTAQKKLPLWAVITASCVVLCLVIGMIALLAHGATKAVDATNTDLGLWYYTEDPTDVKSAQVLYFVEGDKQDKNFVDLVKGDSVHQYNNIANVDKIYLKVEQENTEGFSLNVTANQEEISANDAGYYEILVDGKTDVVVKNSYSRWKFFKKSSIYQFSCSQNEFAKLAGISYLIDEGEAKDVPNFEPDTKAYAMEEPIPVTAKILQILDQIPEGEDFEVTYTPSAKIDVAEIVKDAKVGEETPVSVSITVTDNTKGLDENTYTLQFVVEAKQPVVVPDVIGKSEAQAVKALQNAGLYAKVKDKNAKQERENGKVQSSNPAAGIEVEPGSTITISVGRWEQPKSTATPKSTAKPTATPRPTPTPVPSISSSPEPDLSVPPTPGGTDSYINGDDITTVPDVVGKTEADAKKTIQNAELTVTVSYKDVDDKTKNGKVLSVSPSVGTSEPKGTTVTITVGTYVEPTEEEKKVTVPNVLGMSAEDAEKTLQALKLNVNVEYVENNAQVGKVISSDTDPGTSVKPGTIVTITVGKLADS